MLEKRKYLKKINWTGLHFGPSGWSVSFAKKKSTSMGVVVVVVVAAVDIDGPILIVDLALSRQSCSACFLFKWKDIISIFLLAIWWKFLCWCFVCDQRRTANSVSAVSHFWALLFFLDLSCFYELILVFDGESDSDVL